jgi:hypothetical protein
MSRLSTVWKSSSTKQTLSGDATSSFTRVAIMRSVGKGDVSSISRAAGPNDTTASSAETTHDQNVDGSLSDGSSEIHATPVPSLAISSSHSASNVDLPKPAGADTSTNRTSGSTRSLSASLGRATRPRRRFGTYNLVAMIG